MREPLDCFNEMRCQLNWILKAAFRLLHPHIVPIWMLLRRRPATLADVILWPFLYILLNMQFAWLRLRTRRCETESQRKLTRKIYNIEGGASFFLGLYEAGAALALSGVPSQRAGGVLLFLVYFYVPYALFNLWAMHMLDKLSTCTAVQPAHGGDGQIRP